MDGHRFDDLTRVLARRGSRRGLLGVLAGAARALATRAPVEAACGPDLIDRRGLCVCKATGRPPGADGHCSCPNGTIRCDGECVNVLRSLDHCGACGNACSAGSDVAVLACRAGVCAVAACAAGLANCDGDLTCETALGTDEHCSACGDECDDYAFCDAGMCRPCGGVGEPCCPRSGCGGAFSFCDGGICRGCGGLGERCCPGSGCRPNPLCEGACECVAGVCNP